MYSSQEWWSNTAGGGGDPGDPIGQSLRFRGANGNTGLELTCPVAVSGDRSWTWSGWIKIAGPWTCTLFTPTTDVSPSSTSSGLYINSGGKLWYQNTATNVADSWRGYGNLSDVSAWYHVVFTVDVDNNETNGYINGVKAGDTNVFTSAFQTFSGNMRFAYGGGSYGQVAGDFYAAEVHLIDGQVLEPTAFGRFNEQNIWVPKAVDFGNALPKYSSYLIPTVGDVGSGGDMPAAFDGDLASYAFTAPGGELQFAPPTPIYFTSLRCANNNSAGTCTFTWDGNTVTAPGAQTFVTVFDGAGEISADKPLIVNSTSGSVRAELSAIEITDGQGTRILTDPYLWTQQLFTSPGYGNIDYNSTEQNFQGGSPVENGFDNQTNTFVQCNAGNSWFFKPQGLTATKIEIQLTNPYGDPTGGAFEFNGVEQTGFPGQSWYTVYEGAPITDWTIGGWYRPDGGNGFSIIRVNGVVLQNGFNPSYGENGFYLDFSDPNDIGADRSGNGNNFTAVGFNTVKTDGGSLLGNSGTPADQQVALGTVQLGSLPQLDTGNRAQIYDIDLGSEVLSFSQRYRTTNMENRWMQLFTSNTGDAGDWTQIDERQFGPSANAAYDFNVTFPTAARYLRITQTATQGAAWQPGVWNIQFVDDEVNPDYDQMQDSPTQNFATFNSILGTGTVPTQAANLSTNAGSSWQSAAATFRLTSGRWVWEALRSEGGGYVGIASQTFDTNPSFIGTNGYPAYSVQLDLSTYTGKAVYHVNSTATPGSITSADYGTTQINADSTVRVRLDVDNTQIAWDIDGVEGEWVDYSQWLDDYPIYPIASAYTGYNVSVNYGQQPFINTPPAGFEALQTQNLPESTILDGRDHFQAITGPGNADGVMWREDNVNNNNPTVPLDLSRELGPWNGTATYSDNFGIASFTCVLNVTQDTFTWTLPSGFSSGAVMYVSEDGTTWRNFNVDDLYPPATATPWPDQTNFTVDDGTPIKYVRWMASDVNGGLNCGLQNPNGADGILGAAKATFPNGLWWIKDRVSSNQHQLVDSVTNASQGGGDWASTMPTAAQVQAYSAPSGDSVAWCWDASNPAKSGFNIVQYTGQNPTVTTVPHGLPAAPDLIITQAKVGAARNTAVYHSYMGGGMWVELNGTGAATGDATMWNNQDPDETNFYVGAANTSNFAGATFTAYCWTSIPGYSQVGGFDGNNDADGPYIYTGFKPAFIAIRAQAGGDSFFLMDTTRSPHNPSDTTEWLASGGVDAEGAYSTRPIDILSNGFKIRSTAGSINGGKVIYFAFAENPFQSPVTAR